MKLPTSACYNSHICVLIEEKHTTCPTDGGCVNRRVSWGRLKIEHPKKAEDLGSPAFGWGTKAAASEPGRGILSCLPKERRWLPSAIPTGGNGLTALSHCASSLGNNPLACMSLWHKRLRSWLPVLKNNTENNCSYESNKHRGETYKNV